MNTAVNPEFVVTIPAKPYVKRFIELMYGLPADFSQYPKIQEMVHRCLKKPCTRYDRKYKSFQLSTYSDNLEIVISKHYFDRYGCEFSITDSVDFGRHFEFEAKNIMRDLIRTSLSLGKTIKTSIIEIREMLGFYEYQWKYESIKKDFKKHGSLYCKISFQKEIHEKVMRISLKASQDYHLITDKFYGEVFP